MTKHTPGPWEARGKNVCVVGSRGLNGLSGCICHCQGAGEGKSEINDKAKANARLIASAPQMLEALTLAHISGKKTMSAIAWQAVEAALKAAKGAKE